MDRTQVAGQLLGLWRQSLLAAGSDVAGWLVDDRALGTITPFLTATRHAPGTVLFEEGAEGTDALVLVEGAVTVSRTGADGTLQEIRTVAAPSTVGGVELALGVPRATRITVARMASVISFTRPGLRKIAHTHPPLAVALLRALAADLLEAAQQSRLQQDTWSRDRDLPDNPDRTFTPARSARASVPAPTPRARAALSRLPCLDGASGAALLAGIGSHLRMSTIAEGACMVADGSDGDELLVLLEGEASISSASGRELGRFRGGSADASEVFIGELGFLREAPRSGTVLAETRCTVLEIPARAVPWLVDTDPILALRLHVALVRTAALRLLETDQDRDRLDAVLGGDLDAWFVG